MSKKDEEIVVGLDLGTTKVCTVVAERAENGNLSILGVGTSGNLGLKQGMVISIDETVEAIGKSVEEAEGMSGVEIHAVVTGISGGHLRGTNNRAMVGVRGGEVTADDIGNVLEQVRAVELSRDDEIIHVAPQKYILDARDAISDPVGMAGDRLAVEAHIITGTGTATHNLLNCVQRAGLQVAHMIPQPMASAYAVLSPEELELGVALVDIGGGTTDLTIFLDGSVWHTWVLPMGGNHITKDVSFGLATPLKEAERIKVQFGSALPDQVGEQSHLEVPGVGGHLPKDVSQRLLAEVIEARMEEIMALVAEEIHRTGFAPRIASGMVITGGGSLLPGAMEIAEATTGLVTRRGVPTGLAGLAELATNPKNATAVGLTRCALSGMVDQGADLSPASGMRRLKHWVKEFF